MLYACNRTDIDQQCLFPEAIAITCRISWDKGTAYLLERSCACSNVYHVLDSHVVDTSHMCLIANGNLTLTRISHKHEVEASPHYFLLVKPHPKQMVLLPSSVTGVMTH